MIRRTVFLLAATACGGLGQSLPQGGPPPGAAQPPAGVAAAASSAASGSFSVANSPAIVRLQNRTGDAEIFLTTSESKPCETTLTVTDLDAQASGAKWTLRSAPKRVPGSTAPCFWTMTWTVRGVGMGETSNRRMRIQGNNRAGLVTPAVQNQTWPDQTVTLGAVPHELNQYVREVEIPATIQGTPLTSVDISSSSLVDPATGIGIPASEMEASVRSLDDRNARIVLRIKDSFTRSGNFAGQVILRSPEAPQIGPATLTVHSTSGVVKLLGALIIVAGCIVYGWFGVLRQKSRYLDSLAPATALQEKAKALKKRAINVAKQTGVHLDHLLGNTTAPVPIPSELDTFIDQLSEQKLRTYLPSKWWPGLLDDGARSAAYTSMLQSRAPVLESYSIIIALGLEIVAQSWASLSAAARLAAKPHLVALDRMAVMPDAPAQIKATVQAQVAAALPALGGGDAPAHTTETLAGEIRSTAFAAWAFGIALVIALGVIAQVCLNTGFGTYADYLKCVLWGCGLPAAGQTLQSLTPGSILSAFNLQLPK